MKTRILPTRLFEKLLGSFFFFVAIIFSSNLNAQAESNNMITYDTVFTTGSGASLHTWTIRITRPLNMFTPNHPDTASRPVIIFMPGAGEVGTNPAFLTRYGPHYWLNNGWDGSVVLGNGIHYPILISIITSVSNVRPGPMLACMNIILNNYRIKRNSVHVTGLSMGSMTWGRFLCFAQSPGDETTMSMVTSFTALQGIANDLSIGYNLPGWAAFGHWAKKFGGKFFGLEGTNDNRGVYNARNAIRDSVPGSGYFSFETIGGGTHCCWNTMYSPTLHNWRCEAPVTSSNIGYNTMPGRDNTMGSYLDNSSIFQWMLRQGDTTLVTGVLTNQPPVVNAGTNLLIQLPTNLVNLTGTVSDEGGAVTYNWTKISGGAAVIASPNSLSTTITGLVQGTYIFELAATDTGNLTGTDQVEVVVNSPISTGILPSANKVLVGPGEYQVGFIDTDKHLWGLGNLSNIGINGVGVAGVPKRALVVPFDLKFKTVAGGLHGLGAVDTAGNVWIMGDNDQYQFGNGTLIASDLPQKILTDSAGNTFTNIRDLVGWFVKDGSNGYNGFYAVKQDGTLWGWGRMVFGMRGDGTAGEDKPRPVQIIMPGGRLVKQIVAGQFAIALCTDGTVWTWGQGASAANLGMATTSDTAKWYPRQLNSLSNITLIAGGSSWNYALRNDNVLYGWGSYGDYMGNSNGLPITVPTVLTNIVNSFPQPISKIVTNSFTTHAILNDGSLWGWGNNGQGTVGNGQRINFNTTAGSNPFDRGNLVVLTPYNVAPGVVFDTIFGSTVYTYYSYARDTAGNLYAWGRGKSAVLANQLRASSAGVASTYGNTWDIAWPTPVNPFSIFTSFVQTADVCLGQPTGSPCNQYAIPANTAPVANAGPDQNISANWTNLNATASTDNVFISRYEWRQLTGPNSSVINLPASKTPRVSNLVTGIYTYELLTEDNGWFTDRDTVTIYVNTAVPPLNQAPTSNAGADQTITLPINSVTLTGSGTDPDGTIASYQWTKLTGPAQFNIVAPTAAQTVVNNLVQGVYSFELRVTDNQGGIGRDTVVVTVNAAPPPPNQLPSANAGANQTITLPTNSVTFTGSGTDPDGTIASYQWTKLTGPAQFNIVAPTAAQTVVNNLVQGVYSFELRVTDNQGGIGRDTVVVTVNAAPPANQAPTANAGPDQTIILPTNTTTLNGSGTDPDGTIVSYDWSKISGPAQFVVVSPAFPQTVINNLVQGVYQFVLTVTDNQGATGRDTVVVTVNAAPPPPPPANQAPTANAGADQSITLPTNAVNFNGSGTDPDGTIASYQWTKITGPAQFNIVSASSAQTAVNSLVQGVYQFVLTVTDNQGATGRDTVVVTVNAAPPPPPPANQAPTANAGADQSITLPTNAVNFNGSGTDPDGTIASYQWTKIAGPAQFNIVSASSAQTVVNSLVQGVYQFVLTVTDNQGATGRDTVVVTVNAAPPPPPPANQAPIANAGIDQNITLPTNTVNLNGSGTDPDGTIVTYQWTKIAGPGQFNIVSASAAQTIVNNLVQGVYQFVLTVTDNQGANGRDTVVVTVNAAPPPVNQAPAANAGADRIITLPVNSVLISGNGTDPDGTIVTYRWTKISGPSQYTIAAPNQAQTEFTNLVQGVYEFELAVTDNQGAIARDIVRVTVEAEPQSISTAKIFPNPAVSTINIRIDAVTNANKTKITIVNMAGMIVFQKEVMRTQQVMVEQVDVSRFAKGSYVITIGLDINNSMTLLFIKK